MNSVLLKDANVRELPDHGGVQIILRENLPVDEVQLSADVEAMIEKELHVSMKVQISTPQTDARPQEPVIDLSQAIAINIDIE
jgi:hypothetical protein